MYGILSRQTKNSLYISLFTIVNERLPELFFCQIKLTQLLY